MAFCSKYSLYKNMDNNIDSTVCGYYNDIEIPFDETDYVLEVPEKYNQKPGGLAKELYGSERLGWIFLYFNRAIINDPIFDLTSGKLIVVPTKERLLKYF